MTDPTDKLQEDREAAVRAWEKQARTSWVADDRKKKTNGLAIAAIAASIFGVVWYMKHDGSDLANPSGNSSLNIAERKPVPKLKDQEPVSVPAVIPSSQVPADDPMKSQREQMALQREEQERRMREARLKSALIPPNTSQQPAMAAPHTEGSAEEAPANAGLLSSGNGERGAQDPNSRFARAVSGTGVAVSKADRIDNLTYKILQGKLIEAVLEPRAISDLPGMVCATIQRDVYGAQDRIKLLPWGSRLCGVYSAELRKGQGRLFVIWNTVRRPDGVQVALDSAGADQLGTVGMGGTVDTHFAQIFGMSALLTIIGAGAANAGVGSGDAYNSAAAYRQSVQQAAAQTSQSVLQPYSSIPPTITVAAGSRLRIYVNKDLDFTPIYQDEIDAAQRNNAVTFIP